MKRHLPEIKILVECIDTMSNSRALLLDEVVAARLGTINLMNARIAKLLLIEPDRESFGDRSGSDSYGLAHRVLSESSQHPGRWSSVDRQLARDVIEMYTENEHLRVALEQIRRIARDRTGDVSAEPFADIENIVDEAIGEETQG